MQNKQAMFEHTADNTGLFSDAAGIVQLIRSAQDSLKALHADEDCVALLAQCIGRISTRYGVTGAKTVGASWQASSMDCVVRLLVYAQAEVTEALGDVECGKQLKHCIDHLLQRHFLFNEQYACTPCTSH
jgi:hypothetical protein